MDFSKITRLIVKSMGMAIGMYFTVYYMGVAIFRMTKDSTQGIAVLCIATVITIVTLLNSKKKEIVK